MLALWLFHPLTGCARGLGRSGAFHPPPWSGVGQRRRQRQSSSKERYDTGCQDAANYILSSVRKTYGIESSAPCGLFADHRLGGKDPVLDIYDAFAAPRTGRPFMSQFGLNWLIADRPNLDAERE